MAVSVLGHLYCMVLLCYGSIVIALTICVASHVHVATCLMYTDCKLFFDLLLCVVFLMLLALLVVACGMVVSVLGQLRCVLLCYGSIVIVLTFCVASHVHGAACLMYTGSKLFFDLLLCVVFLMLLLVVTCDMAVSVLGQLRCVFVVLWKHCHSLYFLCCFVYARCRLRDVYSR